MKKLLISVFASIFLLTLLGMNNDVKAQRRNATEVDDVNNPYTADEWIISPDEESQGDEDAKNAIETDIKGVISAYDNTYLRVDILLYHTISYDWATFYAIKFEYDDMNEYYTYYTDTKKLIYEKEVNGEVVKTKTLTGDNSGDVCGVTSSSGIESSDVYFIINKNDHIDGEKGNRYYLTCTFYAGYLTKDDKLHIADQTIPVDLEFEY